LHVLERARAPAEISYSLSFFTCPDVPRLRHSFPTRRSSDLAAALARRARSSSAAVGSRARRFVRAQPTYCVLASSRRSAESVSADRKSTRLNSSHLGISYAVFCLKKKKTV